MAMDVREGASKWTASLKCNVEPLISHERLTLWKALYSHRVEGGVAAKCESIVNKKRGENKI